MTESVKTPDIPEPELSPWRDRSVIAVFLLIVVGWPILAITTGPTSPDELSEAVEGSRLYLYASTGLMLWLIFVLVWIGQRLGRLPFTELGFTQPRLMDPVIGFAFLFAANVLLNLSSWVLEHVVGMAAPDMAVQMILPTNGMERAGWVLLAISAGICEETCFRGFVLLRGITFLKGRWPAVLVSSVAFGSGHLYQGDMGALLIFLYGVLFCVLRLWQQSLWPGIWAHVWQDLSVMALGPIAGP